MVMVMRKPFKLSVRAVIRDENGRWLLLKRSRSSKTNSGKWELPGGKIDDNEPFDHALIREIYEETGLTATVGHPFGLMESDFIVFKVVHLVMECKIESGQVAISDEHEEYAWVDPKEIPLKDLADYMHAFIRDHPLS